MNKEYFHFNVVKECLITIEAFTYYLVLYYRIKKRAMFLYFYHRNERGYNIFIQIEMSYKCFFLNIGQYIIKNILSEAILV